MSRPDPRIYALVYTRLGVRHDETVFVDDTHMCVAGAREAGIHAVHYRDNAQAIEEIGAAARHPMTAPAAPGHNRTGPPLTRERDQRRR